MERLDIDLAHTIGANKAGLELRSPSNKNSSGLGEMKSGRVGSAKAIQTLQRHPGIRSQLVRHLKASLCPSPCSQEYQDSEGWPPFQAMSFSWECLV